MYGGEKKRNAKNNRQKSRRTWVSLLMQSIWAHQGLCCRPSSSSSSSSFQRMSSSGGSQSGESAAAAGGELSVTSRRSSSSSSSSWRTHSLWSSGPKLKLVGPEDELSARHGVSAELRLPHLLACCSASQWVPNRFRFGSAAGLIWSGSFIAAQRPALKSCRCFTVVGAAGGRGGGWSFVYKSANLNDKLIILLAF